MKLFFRYILLLLFLTQLHLLDAQNNLLLQKTSITFNAVTIDEAIKQLSQKTAVDFAYNSSIIPKNVLIHKHFENEIMQNILDYLFKETSINYQVVENQVILMHNPQKKPKKEEYTLSGFLKDEKNGETLIGATIFIPSLNSGTITNAYGFYSLTLPEGEYEVLFSFLGFITDTQTVNLSASTKLSLELSGKKELMQEIVIHANDDPLTNVLQKGESSLKPATMNAMPSLMGEADVIKSLQAIPGIKSFGDGSTSFFVRGGNRDQNLILIDEAPIFNPSHLFGLYSTFIPEAIKDVKIYKGNIPANYGGRLSSLIDIRTRDGNMKQWEFGVNLGIVASKLTVNGPLIKNQSSVFFSRRKSHIRKLMGNTVDENSDFYFSDLNLKLNYIFNDRNRLYLSIYNGEDVFSIQNESDKNSIQWNNFAATLRWNHTFSNKLFSNTTVHTSNYDYKLYMSHNNSEYWNSTIANLNFKTDLSYFFNPENSFRLGFNAGVHSFNPGNYHFGELGFENNLPKVSPSNASEFSLYLNNNHKFKSKLAINYGLRFTNWTNFGEATIYQLNNFYQVIDTLYYTEGEKIRDFHHLEPRINLKYTIGKHQLLKASYIFTTQYIQLISNSVSPFTSLDVWLPSGQNIPPQNAHQYALGYEKKCLQEQLTFTIETFYKKMQHQIDYIDHAYMLLNPLLESQLRYGDAWSYGLETMLRKDAGKFTGWIAYSYARTFLQIDEINSGEKFPAFFDRPHDLTIYLAYAFSKRFSVSVNWIYTSGAAFTSPTSFYEYNGYTVPVYASKNNDRLPDYHRLDFALSYRLNKKEQRFNHGIDFSIFNLYNHKNPIHVNFNKHYDVFGNIAIPGNQDSDDLITTSTYLYTFLPSFSYYLRF